MGACLRSMLLLSLALLVLSDSLVLGRLAPRSTHPHMPPPGAKPATLQIAGSKLPDCSHACGSCSPCHLVMVSFICASEAETCPMAYRCMCHSKAYPVP